MPLQRVHSEGHVGAWHVGHRHGQQSLFEQTQDHDLIAHTLLEDRVPPGLTDEHVRPLHDDDRHEESGVARELDDLPLAVGPLLSVRVLHGVVASVVPLGSDTEQAAGQKTVLHHDDELGKGFSF